jgi:hypothetical protein
MSALRGDKFDIDVMVELGGLSWTWLEIGVRALRFWSGQKPQKVGWICSNLVVFGRMQILPTGLAEKTTVVTVIWRYLPLSG